VFDDVDDELLFDELANGMLEQGLQVSPSELHGCLSGVLAGGAESTGEAALRWLQRCLGLELVGDLAGQIIALYETTAVALEAEEMAFSPLLPDESFELTERVTALGDWSRGFVAGYATVVAERPASERSLRSDSAELLSDMTAIAQAVADDAADEDDVENDLFDVAEYLRVAAMNVYLDTLAQRPDPAPPPRGKTLH